MARALLAVTAVSSVAEIPGLSSLTGILCKTVTWGLTVIGSVLSFVLGIQSSLAKSADSLSAQAIRFAVGNTIPIVGGTVSDALSSVSAGLSVIKNAVGGMGIFFIVILVLPVLIKLIGTKLVLSAGSISAELLGCGDTSRIIQSTNSVLSVFFGAVAITSVLFIFALVLFMNSGCAY